MFISKCKFSKLSFTVFMIVPHEPELQYTTPPSRMRMGILLCQKDNLEFLNKIQIIQRSIREFNLSKYKIVLRCRCF
jgi:hypothetical protein